MLIACQPYMPRRYLLIRFADAAAFFYADAADRRARGTLPDAIADISIADFAAC